MSTTPFCSLSFLRICLIFWAIYHHLAMAQILHDTSIFISRVLKTFYTFLSHIRTPGFYCFSWLTATLVHQKVILIIILPSTAGSSYIHKARKKRKSIMLKCVMLFLFSGDPSGNRTRVTAVKGRCLDRLTNGPYKGQPSKTLTYSFFYLYLQKRLLIPSTVYIKLASTYFPRSSPTKYLRHNRA